MIENWLNYNEDEEKKFVFNLVQITEKGNPDDDLINLLKNEILTSYRSSKFYEFHFGKTASEQEIKEYIHNNVIPKNENQFDKNVRQGDWGEILSGIIASYFQGLSIPINKLRWKYNKDKAVFGTDLIAFNQGETIEDIYYYEIKTRLTPNQKEGKSPNRHYISIHAHNSLLKDELAPTESIADFLERYYVDKEDYSTASKFKNIVLNPQSYNRKFELFLIIEKDNFKEEILTDLHNLPPSLNPLSVTIVFIENLSDLVDRTWDNIEFPLIEKYTAK